MRREDEERLTVGQESELEERLTAAAATIAAAAVAPTCPHLTVLVQQAVRDARHFR